MNSSAKHEHEHGHACGHHHGPEHHHHKGHHHGHAGSTIAPSKIVVSMVLNLVITVVQVVGGGVSGSLALLSDALHNFSDVFALGISYVALKMSALSSSEARTFGYKRAEILAATINGVILIGASLVLFQTAIVRLLNPVAVNSTLMIVIALVGLVANAYSAWLLHRDAHHNMNIRSAYLHLFTDALTSLSVVLGGVMIYFWQLYWIDPLLTLLIGLYVLHQGYDILRDAIGILMQAVPVHIDIRKVQRSLESIAQIQSIHHVHIWQLSEGDIHFQAHVNLAVDVMVGQTVALRQQIEHLLEHDYGINNVILQFEVDACANPRFIKGMK